MAGLVGLFPEPDLQTGDSLAKVFDGILVYEVLDPHYFLLLEDPIVFLLLSGQLSLEEVQVVAAVWTPRLLPQFLGLGVECVWVRGRVLSILVMVWSWVASAGSGEGWLWCTSGETWTSGWTFSTIPRISWTRVLLRTAEMLAIWVSMVVRRSEMLDEERVPGECLVAVRRE